MKVLHTEIPHATLQTVLQYALAFTNVGKNYREQSRSKLQTGCLILLTLLMKYLMNFVNFFFLSYIRTDAPSR